MMTSRPIILFDGICNLCNGAVQFILHHERTPHFYFASLQSEVGQQLLVQYELPVTLDSIVLLDEDGAHIESDAIFRIAQQLKMPYSLIGRALRYVPTRLRNKLYRYVASSRYRWFGKRDVCQLPTAEIRDRFLT